MATRTSAELKQAFKRFVELVKPIEDVQYVVASDDEEPQIATYITKLDEAVSSKVHHAEFQIMDEFPDLLIDFHVWYLEGRTLKSFIGAAPPLTYARNNPASH